MPFIRKFCSQLYAYSIPLAVCKKIQQTSFIEFKESIDHFWSRQQENMLHNHLEVWSKTINMLFLIDFYKIHTNIINLSPKVPFKNSNRDARSIKPVHVTRMSIYLLVKKNMQFEFYFLWTKLYRKDQIDNRILMHIWFLCAAQFSEQNQLGANEIFSTYN